MKCSREGCKNHPIKGATVCRVHGGNAPQVRARAAVRAEVLAWRLEEAHEDPGEVLLRLVTQSAARVRLYGEWLRLATESERLAGGPVDLPKEAWALIGFKMGVTKDGDTVPVEEATRGLAALEAAERERCASFATKAIAAGLAERQVRLAERLGGSLIVLLDGLVSALGHDPADPAVRQVIEAQLGAIEQGSAA